MEMRKVARAVFSERRVPAARHDHQFAPWQQVGGKGCNCGRHNTVLIAGNNKRRHVQPTHYFALVDVCQRAK
jgi:hypothetical protein